MDTRGWFCTARLLFLRSSFLPLEAEICLVEPWKLMLLVTLIVEAGLTDDMVPFGCEGWALLVTWLIIAIFFLYDSVEFCLAFSSALAANSSSCWRIFSCYCYSMCLPTLLMWWCFVAWAVWMP